MLDFFKSTRSSQARWLARAVACSAFAMGGVWAQGADCQAGTGPYAGHETLEAMNTAASATPNVCAHNPAVNAAAGTRIRHVLLMDWSNGGHSKLHTQRHMYRLARKYGFRLDRSQSNSYITPQTLQGVDVVVFNNGDGDPLLNETSLAAMRDFIETQGKGMLAIHAALQFVNCPSQDLGG